MAYESWSQVVIRTVLEWERRNTGVKSTLVIPELKTKSKRKSA
ncbi:hypothetical protein [Nostoc sp. FACHB-280]|nr:hypothetical protein [Nostoc sp. FACHB-280]